uniref:Uncharacterized protein n=1 Tax=Arundo donax TaxID=35708 RepID=A0A0A9CB42_ARUDO
MCCTVLVFWKTC